MIMRELAEKYYRLLIRAASGLQSPFLLAMRLYWGWQFMQTGWGKLSDIHKVVGFFTQLGIPAPALNAWFVSGLEFAGGLMLIVGLGSRLVALPLVIDMIVAYITADREALFSNRFQSRQIYGSSALYLPRRLVDHFDFRPRQGFRGCPACRKALGA